MFRRAPQRWRAAVVAALAAIVLLAGCSSADDEAGEGTDESSATIEPVSPVEAEIAEAAGEILDEVSPIDEAPEGYVVWVTAQEPPDLHLDDPDNGTEIASWIRQGLLEGLFGVGTDLAYYPELLDGEPQVTINDDGTVTIDFRLRGGLTWSDGTPLTSADVAYTHDILIEGCETESDGSVVDNSLEGCQYSAGPRVGYDLVTSFEVLDDDSFTLTLASYFPDWRSLYDQVFAAHAFGEDAFSVNRNLQEWSAGGVPLPSSGPLMFELWSEGRSIQLARNDAYHGSVSPDAASTGPAEVAGVVVAFEERLDDRIAALLDGRADLMMEDLDLAQLALADDESFTVAVSPGPVFEHWGLNLLDPHLAKPEVRTAMVQALDKGAIVTQVYEPLVGEVLPANGLGNAYWMPTQAGYQNHQAAFDGSQIDAAVASLEAAGYVRGGDGVFEHPEDGRLAIRVGTTAGNSIRDESLELGKSQLEQAGFQITIASEPGGLFFSRGPFAPEAIQASASGGTSGDGDAWDVAQFSWVSGPWPGRVSGSFRSGSSTNPYGFANPEFDVAATDCDGESDPQAVIDCYNRLDRFLTTTEEVADGLFVIPLTQRPRFYGYSSGLAAAGPAPDVDAGGPLVNIVDARLAE
ncbi:MAG: ABC transporter substrate-binding protein [Actinomycetota bacterium]